MQNFMKQSMFEEEIYFRNSQVKPSRKQAKKSDLILTKEH